jgi:hypothetical protein
VVQSEPRFRKSAVPRSPARARGLRLALKDPGAAGEVFTLCEAQCAPIRLWIEQIVAAGGTDIELIRVPDATLPGDLDITADIAQHWVASAEKASRQVGWRHADVGAPGAPSVQRDPVSDRMLNVTR